MEGKRRKLQAGGWLFLLLVAGSYAIVAKTDPDLASRAFDLFAQIIVQVLPILALVFLLLLAADMMLEPEWIKHNLGTTAGPKGWFLASVGGVMATGPIYPWYALLHELRNKGMSPALIAVFLYSRAIKLPLLPLMAHYFGIVYTVVLCLCLLLFAVVTGFLIGFVVHEETS